MTKRIEFVVLLACLIVTVPAMGTSIPIWGGSNNAMTSPGGSISGGAFITTDVTNDDELGFITGITASAMIPKGVQGFAYSHWSKVKDIPMTLSASGGNSYLLDASYNGWAKVGVRKTSDEGVASSSAQLSSKVYANGETNSLNGLATIEAATSNTGSGETYAMASGSTKYDVKQTESFSVWGPVEEVYGEAKGTIKLTSSNYGGKVSGNAHITARSQADEAGSISSSRMDTSMSASGQNRGCISSMDGSAEGSAKAGAWDGSTPDILEKKGGTNENVFAQVSGSLYGSSDAYLPGDMASQSSMLSTRATNTVEGDGFNEALSTAGTKVSVVRKDSSSSKAEADAKAVIKDSSFKAISRNNIVIPAVTFAESRAKSIDMRSDISARGVWSGDNSISATLRSLYDARDDSVPEVYLADISNQIVNHGPVKTAGSADISSAEEHLRGQRVTAQDDADIASVYLADKNILSFITGKGSNPWGKVTITQISSPAFDDHRGSKHTLIGPAVTSVTTPKQEISTITYEAKSYFSQ